MFALSVLFPTIGEVHFDVAPPTLQSIPMLAEAFSQQQWQTFQWKSWLYRRHIQHEMRREMIVMMYFDDNSIKSADFRHTPPPFEVRETLLPAIFQSFSGTVRQCTGQLPRSR